MEWKTVKLGEVADVKGGKRLPKGVSLISQPNKHPYIRIRDIGASKYLELTQDYECVDDVTQQSIKRYIVNTNDILLSIVGTIGLVGVVGETLNYANQTENCVKINNLHGIDRDYLYYYLVSSLGQQEIKLGTVGAVQAKLPLKNVQSISIPLPSLEDQHRIAAILSSFDDKIENNNRINRNLEAQAQALFKSWFVDFEPWGGTMPEDWKEYQLTEFAEIISGYSYKGAELMPSEDAMATIKNFDRKGYFKLDGYKEIQISGRLKNSQILNLFDVIVAHTDITQQADIIGNPAIILSKGGYRNIIMSMDLCKVQPTHYAISSAFLYCLLKDNRFKSHALGYVNGTTVLHMSKKALPEYRVFLPNDLSKVQELGDQLQNLYKRYSINLEESARLAALRDTLLPKLMKGEIEVA